MDTRLKSQLDFIIEIDKMKNIFRQTLIMDGSRHENDAEHSWHLAMMAMTLAEYSAQKIDIDRVVKMALVHDLVEVYAGDTFAYDTESNKTKEKREKEAADRLFALLPAEQGKKFRSLWEEFDAMDTPDSRYAASIDRLQPLMCNHLTEGHTWVEHDVSVEDIYKRMAPIKTAIPELWDYVESVVAQGIERGYIRT